jgi:ferredoxin
MDAPRVSRDRAGRRLVALAGRVARGRRPAREPWGGIETPWPLYGRLKQAFDPGGLLGPSGVRTMSAPDLKGPDRATILNCVHCGLCLSSCPTYRETKLETESPRGRIYLMRALSRAARAVARRVAALRPLPQLPRVRDRVPGGVHYGLLLETTRARLALELPPTLGERVRNFALKRIFGFQDRLDLVLAAMRTSSRLGLLALGARAARAAAAEVRARRRRAVARGRARRGAHGARRLSAVRGHFEGARRVVPHLPHCRAPFPRPTARGRPPCCARRARPS